MARIDIDRGKSEALFYKFKDLGLIVLRMNEVVQNPDFADTRDVEVFKENCEMFEKEYISAKNAVIELFKQ